MKRSPVRLFVVTFFAVSALVAVAGLPSGCDEERCGDRSDEADYRARANECGACMNERDCINSAFNCGSECGEVIP